MATYAIGWLVLLFVTAFIAIELLRGTRRWQANRRDQLDRVQTFCQEIDSLRKRVQSPAATSRRGAPAWQGSRKFRVERKQRECSGCHSFYLVPQDGRRLPAFEPGQFLTFTLNLPEETNPVVRCYSLSAAPRPDFYRCTVRRVLPPSSEPTAPPGKASHFFNCVVNEGDILDIKAPRGTFTLDVASDRPIVLIAAGVGITPLFCMLEWLANANSNRKVRVFYGVRNSEDHIYREELARIAANYPDIELTTCYSRPLPADQLGRDYEFAGRVTIETIRSRLDEKDAEFYLCGPGEFMQQMKSGLIAWGIPGQALHFEAFGPSSVRKVASKPASPVTNGKTTVEFARSDKMVPWPAECASLLELAERHGIAIESGCRSGNCGTCATTVKSGRFEYIDEPTIDCEDGDCFPCICVPSESIVLDA